KFEVRVKSEKQDNEEPIQLQDDEMECKEEFDITEELIAFTGKKYQCSQIDKAFPHNNTSKKHHITHTEEKTIEYNQYDNDLSRKCHLVMHQRKYTVDKPYQCNQCDKAFSRNDTLINHQRTHITK
ncbi:unnamed protein product, partial [Meganyctiphanes norvegica]